MTTGVLAAPGSAKHLASAGANRRATPSGAEAVMAVSHTAAASLAVLALLITGLSVHVSRLRLRHRISFGDGGQKDLLLAIRAHGNTLEQSMLYAMLALGYGALPAASATVLGACAVAFVGARVVHATALFGRRLRLRQAAHVVSIVVHLVLAAAIGRLVWLAA
jgi:uncharacterized membrane protein YecN with MAPEG domain